jgi:DNA-binding NarL/FixJ family response regulator
MSTAHRLGGYPVLIIDDHELFSASLTMALRGRGFDAHHVPVARIEDFLSQMSGLAGLVVLDLDLGRDLDGNRVSGVSLVPNLRRLGWKVLVVSGAVDNAAAAAAIAYGAVGSVPKTSSFDKLIRAVLTAADDKQILTKAEHQRWLALHRRYRAEEHDLSGRLRRLSSREREVLDLLAEGHRAAWIAERFVVSMATVRTQIRAILAKLEVNSQLEAVALLRRQGKARREI